MTEVLSVPIRMEGYYRPSSNARRRPAEPSSYITSPRSPQAAIPRSHLHAAKQPLDTPPICVPSQSRTKSTIINRVAIPPQPERNQFFLGDFDDEISQDLDFPVFDYADTITPEASPDLNEVQPYSSASCTVINPDSSPSLSSAASSAVPSRQTSPESLIFSSLDDTTIKPEPSRHVDYLSHDWKEEEIWSSWRYMITKRDYYQNAARLENASWRTWAKCKYKLKTVSPEKLNWMKDCDVTWLYGPLASREDKIFVITSPVSSPSNEQKGYSSSSTNGKKPILKKRSMSEAMLQRSLSSSSLLQQAAAAIQSQQSERFHWSKNTRPQLAARAHSDFSTYSSSYVRDSEVTTNNLPSAVSSGYNSPSSYQRHIHFNNCVEQCIAVEKADDDNEDEHIEGLYDSDDSSEDGLVMRSTRSSTRGSFNEHQTIAMLPSTTLKEPAAKRSTNSVFSRGITSLFSSVTGSAYTKSLMTTVPTSQVQTNFLLDDGEDDLDDINWQPRPAFANRRDSILVARPRLGKEHDAIKMGTGTDSNADEEVVVGLFGRAVDAVNTARDIAHVLWNVGWRK